MLQNAMHQQGAICIFYQIKTFASHNRTNSRLQSMPMDALRDEFSKFSLFATHLHSFKIFFYIQDHFFTYLIILDYFQDNNFIIL